MDNVTAYLEASLAGLPESEALSQYKLEMTDVLSDRADELTHSGLRDQKVLMDLLKSEFPDLRADFETAQAQRKTQEKQARREGHGKRMEIACTALYFSAVLILYLTVSFLTRRWSLTWLLPAAGLTLWLEWLFFLRIDKLVAQRRVFHPTARTFLAVGVLLLAVFAFLCGTFLFQLHRSWLLLLWGVIVMLIADAVFGLVLKEKLMIINILVYIPIIAALLFVTLGLHGVLPWTPGWVLIPAALLLDLAIIAVRLLRQKKEEIEQEVKDAWSAD